MTTAIKSLPAASTHTSHACSMRSMLSFLAVLIVGGVSLSPCGTQSSLPAFSPAASRSSGMSTRLVSRTRTPSFAAASARTLLWYHHVAVAHRQPLMRAALEANPNLSQADAVALIRKCMAVLFYRDARSVNRVRRAPPCHSRR